MTIITVTDTDTGRTAVLENHLDFYHIVAGWYPFDLDLEKALADIAIDLKHERFPGGVVEIGSVSLDIRY